MLRDSTSLVADCFGKAVTHGAELATLGFNLKISVQKVTVTRVIGMLLLLGLLLLGLFLIKNDND